MTGPVRSHLGWLCALSLLITAGTSSAEAIDVVREGSYFRAEWYAPTSGQWTMRTKSGDVCVSGEFQPGAQIVELTKVAAPEDVLWEVTYTDGTRTSREEIPGNGAISPLEKPDRDVIIYQLPTRTYLAKGMGQRFSGNLRELTEARLAELKALGIDYLWLTGILEQASLDQTDPDVVKGDAGSYYAIYDNWDVSPQIGGLAAFEDIIEMAHGAGIRVMIDIVANHTARYHHTDVVCKKHLDFGQSDNPSQFFNRDNNYYYIPESTLNPPLQNGVPGVDGIFDQDIFTPGIQAESPARVTGNDIISPSPEIFDWFETAKLNYGFNLQTRQENYAPIPKTWNQMVDVARYWILKGVDGFRVDFAHAVPIDFWRYFSEELRKVNPEVFLLGEAYESDQRMRLPGFSYHSFLDAGFDSVYNSQLYWGMRNNARQPGNFRAARPSDTPLVRHEMLENGYRMTQYTENHDEVRLASRHFAPFVADRAARAYLGFGYSVYAALLPGHYLLHGGQELQEDASVFGRFAGDNGRTSIFDFVYQAQTRKWLYETPPAWMLEFRNLYKRLFALKNSPPFNVRHSYAHPSFIDLDPANWYKDQSKYIGSYLRFYGGEAYLVVINSDPFSSHEATIHFTSNHNEDTIGALDAMGISNDDSRYQFTEVFTREGWVPQDPNIPGQGMPGWALFKSGGVPSGLYLGQIPAGSTLIFRIENLQ